MDSILCRDILRGFLAGRSRDPVVQEHCTYMSALSHSRCAPRQASCTHSRCKHASVYTAEQHDGGGSDVLEESEDSDDDNVIDQAVARNVKDPVLKALYRVHRALGHPSNSDLVRFLRSAGASMHAVDMAKRLYCTRCERSRVPKKRRIGAIPPPRSFNDVVGVDCFKVPRWDDPTKDQVMLNIVCWGTGLQQVVPVGGETPLELRTAYRSNWINHYGRPNLLVADNHGSFRGLFSQRARLDGSRIFRNSTEAPWQNSRTERRGGCWKIAFAHCVSEVAPSSEE